VRVKVDGGETGSHARLGDAGRHDGVTEIRTELTDLVVAARNGDRNAEQQLIAAHLPMLYRIVGRALDGHADVDDVVQETVLRAHRDLPSLRAPASFRSWLVAIAMRQTSSRLRAWQQDRERTATLGWACPRSGGRWPTRPAGSTTTTRSSRRCGGRS
jgi:DNA-directed RNA polymerase specialized sigma24 family protein